VRLLTRDITITVLSFAYDSARRTQLRRVLSDWEVIRWWSLILNTLMIKYSYGTQAQTPKSCDKSTLLLLMSVVRIWPICAIDRWRCAIGRSRRVIGRSRKSVKCAQQMYGPDWQTWRCAGVVDVIASSFGARSRMVSHSLSACPQPHTVIIRDSS